jgi:CxxC-x17-CxxC domain-containing protein
MSYHNRGNHSGNNRNSRQARFGRERSEMFSATCANCGKHCEVPFRPTGNKPVLCRECFQNKQSSDWRRPEQKSFDRPTFNRDDNRKRTNEVPDYKAQFEVLNLKMDKILELLTSKTARTAPLESEISEEAIDDIVEEVEEENITKEKKPKKTKTKKSSSPEKK